MELYSENDDNKLSSKKDRKRKSEKESRKKKSRKRSVSIESDPKTLVESTNVDQEIIESAEAPTLETKLSKAKYFAKLLEAESNKPQTGTIHSVGKKQDGGTETKATNSGDWECPRCCTSNFKNSIQCQKCKGMKRMSTYR
jgi:hypothetical protein